jgi:hypothetical protein
MLSALFTDRIYPQRIFLVLMFNKGRLDLRTFVRPEDLRPWNIQVTPSGFETAAFLLVELCLNQLCHSVCVCVCVCGCVCVCVCVCENSSEMKCVCGRSRAGTLRKGFWTRQKSFLCYERWAICWPGLVILASQEVSWLDTKYKNHPQTRWCII